MPTLGENIKAARLELGWTPDQAAEHCDVSRAAWYAYEADKLCPTVKGLLTIAGKLDTTATQLFDGVVQ